MKRSWEDWIPAVFLFIIVALVVAVVAVVIFGPKPDNWHYDAATGTTTWTDDRGRDMIKSPDGSVRELSR